MPHKQQFLDFVRNYIKAPESVVESIVAAFDEVAYPKNEFLLKEGNISDTYFFLADGFMRSFTRDTDGNEVTTYFHSSDKMVFEVASFFTRTRTTENIQAVTDCVGYSISFERLDTLFHAMPEFREFGRAMLVKEFSAFKQRMLALINKSAEERYANLVNDHKEIFQNAQLRHIASFLGITDTSLSRIRKAFARK